MTLFEKFAIESGVAAYDSATVALQDVAAIFNLLSANLPNLSLSDRVDLQNEASNRLKISEDMKVSASKLRDLVQGK